MRVKKGSLVFLLVISMLVCLFSFPVSAIPAPMATTDYRVLLIQSDLPWVTSANTVMLDQLKTAGKFTSYDVHSFAAAGDAAFDLTVYKAVIIANDQSQDSYDIYNDAFKSKLENYASAGGVVLFGACHAGMYGGKITTALPGGTTITDDSDFDNVIVDTSNPIVTAALSDNISLTDSDLAGTWCSHTSFANSSLPAGANVILKTKVTGMPTLVEYALGNGHVIVSGLTWEYSYENPGVFATKAFDDLFLYALMLGNESQAAPTDLLGVAPSTYGAADGKITGTTAAMEYKLSADSTYTPASETEVTGLEAGTYDVRYASKIGFDASDDAVVVVAAGPNASQDAPSGLLGVAPLTYGGTDGKITGTTAAMEYKLSADSVYTPAADTEITDLAAGTYDVRYAALEGFDAGADAVVTVAPGPNAGQDAPSGLVGIAPSAYGAADGKITGTTTAMEYMLIPAAGDASAAKADPYTPVTGTEITGLTAGTYSIRYAAREGFDASADTEVTVSAGPNADQAVPAGLGVTPSTVGGATGIITGTTPAMEYKLSTDTTYIPVTGTEITGLVAGMYDVRYAAKEGYNAGAVYKVEVYNAAPTSTPAPTPTPAVTVAPVPGAVAATGEVDSSTGMVIGLLLMIAAGSVLGVLVWRVKKTKAEK